MLSSTGVELHVSSWHWIPCGFRYKICKTGLDTGYQKQSAHPNKTEVARVTFSDFDFSPDPKLFNSGSGSENCLNLRIRLLFRLCLRKIQQRFHWKSDRHKNHADSCYCLKSDCGSGPGFSHIFDSGSGSVLKRKTQNPAELRSGTLDSTFAQWLQNHGFACPKYCSVAARQPRFACPK